MRLSITILAFTVLCQVSEANAQEFASEFWHKGTAVLVDGDTLHGQIKYDIAKDLIQVEVDDRIYTFGSKKAHFFEIYDITTENYRQFYSLPYTTAGGYKTPVFFEVVYEGRLTLLCREFFTKKTSQYNSYYWPGRSYSRTVVDFEYYFLDTRGTITYYPGKKKDLINIMKDRSHQIKEYIKTYNIKYDQKSDLARVTAYYNTLIES